jgi:hypothetical protein
MTGEGLHAGLHALAGSRDDNKDDDVIILSPTHL